MPKIIFTPKKKGTITLTPKKKSKIKVVPKPTAPYKKAKFIASNKEMMKEMQKEHGKIKGKKLAYAVENMRRMKG